ARYSALMDVQPTADNGLICVGITTYNNPDLWLLKLDSLGCMGDYCGLTDTNCYYMPEPCEDTLSAENIKFKTQNSIRVFPNPANAHIYFTTNSQESAIENITLFDISGKTLLAENCLPAIANCTLNIKELSGGIYFYQAQLTNGSIARGDRKSVV